MLKSLRSAPSLLALPLLLTWSVSPVQASDEQHETRFQFQELAHEIAFPWSLAVLPNQELLVTSRLGALWHLNHEGEAIANVMPDLPELWVDGQAGLFDVALHPDFTNQPYIYLSYACGNQRANTTCLSRGHWNGAELERIETLFQAYPFKRGSAHYGGRIAFLPDQTLVLTLGDGFDYRERAQLISDHLGTTVRLELNGEVPNDNPFVANPKALPEIFSYGHRNVQGIAWHPQLEQLFISEHGPRGGDEINRLRAGGNFGWPLVTGGVDYTGAKITPYRDLPGLYAPEVEWTPSIAPSGLTVYHGDEFAEWQGDLLVPALAGKHVARVQANDDGLNEVERLFQELNQRIRDVRVEPATGALLLLIDAPDGRIIRVTKK